jgi:DNA processing protein
MFYRSRVVAMTDVIDLLALCRVRDVSWSFVAREAQRPGGLTNLRECRSSEKGTEASESLTLLRAARPKMDEHQEWVARTLDTLTSEGVRLTTVLDEDYPANLRVIFNLPPFLFYRGSLREDDARSVAIVGTRDATRAGIGEAAALAKALTECGVTVLSGLARGIDTAAHRATLDAGGRTIAVMGTGVRTIYPAENRDLAAEIAEKGALVSQFWPDTPPRTDTFPRRNIVTSGLSQGTVVVEASATSGAKMQARLALQHGKKVYLLSSLVRERDWARGYLERGAIEVRDVSDILDRLMTPEAVQAKSDQRRQMTLALG